MKPNKNKFFLIGVVVLIIIFLFFGIQKYIASDKGKSEMVKITNQISEDIATDNDYLSGFDWKMGDGSILSLKKDGSFTWHETSSENSSYYSGVYDVLSGNKAIDKIDKEYGFDEDYFSREGAVLRQDVMYLHLIKKSLIVDGKNAMKEGAVKEGKYMLFFTINDKDSASGVNLGSVNVVRMKKIIQ